MSCDQLNSVTEFISFNTFNEQWQEAGPLRQEAQTKRQGHGEGGQGLDAGSRDKEAGPRSQDQLQTQPGPMDPIRREDTKTPGRKSSGYYKGKLKLGTSQMMESGSRCV